MRVRIAVILTAVAIFGFVLAGAVSARGPEPMPTIPMPRGLPANFMGFQLDLLSGGAPLGDAAFDSLSLYGVRTIISVDGARPDIERARAHGMRYVHLPIGYDGIDVATAAKIALAVRDLPGPVYVHCHHGLHRGPAMVAAAQRILGRWTADEAIAFLERAGTSRSYPGLYKSVEQIEPLDPATLAGNANDLPEIATVSGLVEGMAAIDRTWDRLNETRDAGWMTPVEHPDLLAAVEAGILADHLRVLSDDPEVVAGPPDMRVRMQDAASTASALERLLDAGKADLTGVNEAMAKLEASCRACHEAHRN